MSTQHAVPSHRATEGLEAQDSDLDDDDPDEESGLANSSTSRTSSDNSRTTGPLLAKLTKPFQRLSSIFSSLPKSTQPRLSYHSPASRHHTKGTNDHLPPVRLSALRAITCYSYLNILLVFVPLGIASYLTHLKTPIVFTSNAIAIIPLASLLTYATENIARDAGDTIGALVNITFSNLVEVIMLLALHHNQIRVVQASLLGSILVNLLLVLGTAILAGAAFHDHEQLHNRDEAQALACLLCVSVFSMIVPNAFHHSFDDEASENTAVLTFSRASALILISVYFLYIVYQLRRRQSHPSSNSSSARGLSHLPAPTIRFEDPERQNFIEASLSDPHKSFELDDLDFGQNVEQTQTKKTRATEATDAQSRGAMKYEHDAEDNSLPLDQSNSHQNNARGRTSIEHRNHRERSLSAARSASSYSRVLLGAHASTENLAPPPDFDISSPRISKIASVLLLMTSSLLVAVCAEFLINTIDDMVKEAALTEAFIGLIILPIIGNCAEHVTAVTVAAKNKLDLAIGVAVGSAIQAGLVLTPLIVLVGWILNKEMTMYFSLFETVCLVATAFLVNFLLLNGRTNFLEGSLLTACYIIIGVGAFLFPNSETAESSTSRL